MSPGASFGEPGAQPRARFGRQERVGVRQDGGLLLDGADDALVAVADVHAHQLAVEIEIALAVRRPEVHALRARDRDGIDGRLHGPFENRVLLGKGDDLFGSHDLWELTCRDVAHVDLKLETQPPT